MAREIDQSATIRKAGVGKVEVVKENDKYRVHGVYKGGRTLLGRFSFEVAMEVASAYALGVQDGAAY